MMKRRTVTLLLLLGGCLVLIRFMSESQSHRVGELSHEARRVNGEAQRSSDVPDASLGTKTRQREMKKALEFDEMFAALKTPVPGWTHFPEQTLEERILATNFSLKKAGNPVRLGIDEKLYPSQNLLEKILPAFSQENATPNDIIRHAQQTLKQHHYFDTEGGRVLFQEGGGG
jgi:hypothetical protein